MTEMLDFADIYKRFGIKDDEFNQLEVMGHRQISAGLRFLEENYGADPIDNKIKWDRLHNIDEELFPISHKEENMDDSWGIRRGKVGAFISLAGKVCDAIFALRVEGERTQNIAMGLGDDMGVADGDEIMMTTISDMGNYSPSQIEMAIKHVVASRLVDGYDEFLNWDQLTAFDEELSKVPYSERQAYIAKINAFATLCGRSMDAALDRRRIEESSQRVAI